MPRFNVKNDKTGEWRCFSTIIDDWITDWMDEERYQKWREFEYGRHAGKLEDANRMSLEDAEDAILNRLKYEKNHRGEQK